ncbi:MAG: valine--tRNA ligase [Candidatus Sericytochromatia bacterium]
MRILELPTRFNFAEVEAKWTQIWDDKEYFHPQVDTSKPSFSIAFPPPNVTGSLHMGHAANISVQDALVRSRRMQGFNTLWMVGTDHAGIATQVVVERKLKQEENKTRHDLGRPAFLERVWEWKQEYGDRIMHQMKRLGASGDYRRARFTMDADYSRAIRKVFVEWYNAGLIYRAYRLVNWDPVSQTVLSDLEVESEEEKGHLWHIRYPLTSDPSQGIVVATTRPETMLGDTAVAVHPDDERYRDLIGQTVTLPLSGREIPIIGDGLVADPAFGSGAVKITPAHDFNDWDCGQRNGLEILQVIDAHARINDAAPEKYRGMKVNAAREAIVADLEAEGALVKVEDHLYMPGRSSRTNVIVEPLPMEQWFVKMGPLAEPARAAIRSGEVKYVPERWTDKGAEWLENVRDWCISRQLWWGHQIPVWYDAEGQIVHVGLEDPSEADLAKGWRRDEDVLDTWFSSALWPFATLGWPDETPELAHFHPTSVLSTARDIINLWVARMIFSSLYFRKEIPFEHVLIHATILTKDGKRMSKSKGTGIDPLDMVDKFGTDAVRFWLAQVSMSGQDVRFAEEKLESSQHFVTKIWNASRFILMNLADYDASYSLDHSQLQLADRWILSRLRTTTEVVSEALQSFNLTAATRQLYSFIWTELCDWYLEIAKPRMIGPDREPLLGTDRSQVQAILYRCLDTVLRLLHPFMPFVSEELWSNGLRQITPDLDGAHLAVAPWPAADQLPAADPGAEREMELLMETVRVIRNLRMEIGVPANKEVEVVHLCNADAAERAQLQANSLIITSMAKVSTLDIQAEAQEIKQAAHGVSQSTQVILPLAGLIDPDKERERLQRELSKLDKELKALSGRLENPQFRARAPQEVVAEAEQQRTELLYQQNVLQERLQNL